ncbi:MAG: molybdopterin-dependent oxidoreductase, partial [Thermomicrobiales bacterium]
YYAKKAGTTILSVNTYREPGMERYWVPSVVESAVFGTKITDDTFLINGGGDVAFLNGAIKHIFEKKLYDPTFIEEHTAGRDELIAELAGQSWEALERLAGVPEARMRKFGNLVGRARTAVFVWSMGVTQHVTGEDNIRAIINLALTRGFVGRERCGLMPIRGHSGVQGGAEMGCYATAFPGGIPVSEQSAADLAATWGFAVPAEPGLTAPEMMDAAEAGKLDVMFAMGGNFLDVMPDPAHVEQALGRIPLRVHQDIVLSSQMLVDPADTVVLLPATTRYEVPGGVTETSTERRIMFSPQIGEPRAKAARPEWRVFLELARRVRPDLAAVLSFRDTQALREEIARVVPFYDGIQTLQATGDQVQYGGPLLCDGWTFPTGDGKAHFTPVPLPRNEVPEGMFAVATRRGKQFNSIVHERKDAITGAVRESVLMSAADASDLGLKDGDAIRLRNDIGLFDGRVAVAPIQPRNLQIHWPEGNVLINPHRRSPDSHVPDYNAYVTLERRMDNGASSAAD